MIRPVLLSGVYVRLAAVLLLGYGVPLDWPHLRYPGWALLLAVGMAAETALVVGWWLRRGPVAWPLVVDLPAGVGAIVASGLLTAGSHTWTGYVLWTGYAFPYTVVVAITFGLVYRTLVPALLCGVVWGVAQLVVAVGIDGHTLSDSAFVVLPYLLYPTVGGIGARLYRAGIARLDAARELAARQAAEIAAARERARHAQALHDRVLQTVETLTRDRVVADAPLAERLAEDAAWLRRYVETGELDQRDDLSSELAAATRAVGVPVELNDAELRLADAPRLRAPVREALVEATHSALADLTGGDGSAAVVRAERQRGGVLVTILARGPGTRVDEEDLARVRDRLAEVGGELTVEPAPYAELWVPADQASVSTDTCHSRAAASGSSA